MELQIKNISHEFIAFWDKAKNMDLLTQKQLWKDLYEKPNEAIFQHLKSILKHSNEKFNMDKELEYCLKFYDKHFDNISLVAKSITNEIEKTCSECHKLFEIDDIELNFIVMVGLFFANAFVTPYNNTTAFYFLEKIPCNDLKILLAHEITHLFQFSQLKTETYNPTLADNLFNDGLASYSSSIICPNYSLPEYLFGSDKWITECKKHLSIIKSDLIFHLESKDYELFKKYFVGDNTFKNGIPTRSGYLIGYYVIEYLHRQYALSDLITWQHVRIIEEVKNTLLIL